MSPNTDHRVSGRLFVLELSGGRVPAINTDGTDTRVTADGCRHKAVRVAGPYGRVAEKEGSPGAIHIS